jgi:DNA repair exonuclease SbcCD ATPase subunit
VIQDFPAREMDLLKKRRKHHKGNDEMILKDYFVWIIFLIFLFYTSFSFSEEVYRWIDEKGTVHLTDEASKIPERYLGQAERIKMPEEILKASERENKPVERSEWLKRYLEDLEKKIEVKKELEKRVIELEEELRLTEKRLNSVEEIEKLNYLYYQPFKDPKTGKWVPVVSPYHEEKRWLKNKIESIRTEMVLIEERLLEIKRGL